MNTVQKTACNQGSYCPDGTTVEAPCPLGFVCSTPATKVACTTPNYCPPSSTQLTLCAAGSFCPNASSQIACLANSYCLQGVTAPTTCGVCSSGQYIASVCTASANIVCPVCTNLPANAAYTGVGSAVGNCPWACNQGYYLSGGQCLACPAGSWCSANVQNTCPTNSYSVALSYSQNSCLCLPGYAGNGSVTGTSPCPICNAGSFCPGGNNNVSIACPANFSSPVGASSYSDCQCVPGYLRVNNASCQLCAAGQICLSGVLSTCPSNSNAPQGSSGLSSCVCNPGFYGPNGGTCVQCPANSFCPGGNVQTQCTANAVSPVQSTNATACYCDRGYQGIANAACVACPANTWCWTGVLNNCPANTSSPALSNWWLNCTCLPGFTGPDGTACSPCVAGSYKTSSGSAACSACSANSYCPQGAINPTACPLANSNSPVSSMAVTQCQCNPGYYGAQCSPCPVTSYCPGGSLAFRCPNNGYTPNISASAASQCVCPASAAVNGTGVCECVGGYQHSVDNSAPAGWRCDTCPANAYCINGVVYPCPAGSTASVGSSSYSACVCAPPAFMTAASVLAGNGGYLGPDAFNYNGKAIHVIRNYIFPQTYSGGSVTVSGWSVTTTKACTLQPLLIRASNWQFSYDIGLVQDYTIIGASEPMIITAAGTVTFQWSNVYGTNVLASGSGPYNFGWYDYSGVDCVSSTMYTSGSQYTMILGPNFPIWATQYNGAFSVASRIQGNYAMQILSTDPTNPVPQIFSCGNCLANQYYISNTQCGA